MRELFPLVLSIRDKGQLMAWSHSDHPVGSLVRNSDIILRLADGRHVNEVAKEQRLSRQTVSKVRRQFLIFGLDGIERCAPRLGRKPTIKGGRADTVLQIALSEVPPKGCRWTGQQLATRCELPYQTVHRFLKRNRVSLGDPRTIREATKKPRAQVVGIAGLFLSSSICVMALSCRPRNSPSIIAQTSTTMGFGSEITSALFSRESERLLAHLHGIHGMLLGMCQRRTDYTDVLMFMDILNDRKHPQREVVLVTNPIDPFAAYRLSRWLLSHPSIHYANMPSDERWTSRLRAHLESVSEGDRRKVAYELEHLNMELDEWLDGPRKSLGVFASVGNFPR